jgi:F-box and leucine-rich repeat protein 9
MEASQYFRLMRKILLHFQVFKYSDNAYPINRFLDATRCFPNIKFSIVKFAPNNDLFWMEFGEGVEELTFNSCLINKSEFLHVIRQCPNLRALNILRCDDLYKSWLVVKKLSQVKMKFPKLKSLAIQDTSILTKPIFNFLVNSMPNLTSLTLSNCFGNMRPRERCELLDSIANCVKRNPKLFKALNLVNTYVDEMFLLKLADIPALKLQELRFTFNGVVSTLGRSGVLTLLRNQTDLKILDVTDSKGFSNFCLMESCKNAKDLHTLILNKCWLINDVGLKEVSRLQNLEVLDVSCCDRITDLGILEGLIPRGREKLKIKELYLGLLPYMSIVAIYRLTQQYDDLRVIDLSGSSNSITDEALHMIFRYQFNLKHLNLDCCAKITDFGLTGLSEVSSDGFTQNFCQYNIDRLEKLEYLNLGGCYNITDKTFYNAFNLSNLKEVNFSRCHNITEIGIKRMCEKCPKLRSIDLSECINLQDPIVTMIAKQAEKIETLKLNGCLSLTDTILDELKSCKYLKVSESFFSDAHQNFILFKSSFFFRIYTSDVAQKFK